MRGKKADPKEPTAKSGGAAAPGEVRGRVLLRDVLQPGDLLFAEPLPGGKLDLGLFPNGPSGGGAGPDGAGFILQRWIKLGHAVTLYGMVGNEVVGVDAWEAGQKFKARMGENAFVLQVPIKGRSGGPDRVILHFRDGTEEER